MTKILENREDTSCNSPWWKKVIAWGGKNWFYITLFLLAAIGVPCAFFIPPRIPGLKDDGNTVVSLRQGILAVLAGALTMLTLWETHRKNTHEKDKNERDHVRQVHAERRSRYTTAVEQLANEKAAVRLGGIYTLVGLVDEWLADDSLAEDKQQEEGQVIINNLCSYIRSPFPLAAKFEEYEARKELEKLQKSGSEKLSEEESSRLQVLLKRFEDSDEYEKPKDITTDYAKFHEEQDVRRAIFEEMSKRSSTLTRDEKDDVFKTVPGRWSHFQLDFSRAPVFYPLSNLTIEKGNFSSAKFYCDASFMSAVFAQQANFRSAVFAQKADFRSAVFVQTADFMRATFAQKADFTGTVFTQSAIFSWATFTQTADFRSAIFTQSALFSWATFTQTADFMRATFAQTADFKSATFAQTTDFKSATFARTTDFRRAKFTKFEPTFAARMRKAQFSAGANRQDYKFQVASKNKPIELGTATLLGKPFEIPVGTVLFDPDSWDEQKKKYTQFSAPAKPLDNSDKAEENKAE